jgi:hypothetical protein
MRYAPLFVSLTISLVLAAGCAEAPPTVHAAPSQGAPEADPFPVLASPAEQARMQKYADDLYDRRYVRSTFHLEGADFDCVDFDKQPGCKNGGCPPAPPAAAGGGGGACPAGTIPVRRPDIRVMRRFPTLEEYLRGGKVGLPHG